MGAEITPAELLERAKTFGDGVLEDIYALGLACTEGEFGLSLDERAKKMCWFVLGSGELWQAACRMGGCCRPKGNLEPERTLYDVSGNRRQTLLAGDYLKTFKEAERNMAATYNRGRNHDNWIAMQEEWLSPLIRAFFENPEEHYAP